MYLERRQNNLQYWNFRQQIEVGVANKLLRIPMVLSKQITHEQSVHCGSLPLVCFGQLIHLMLFFSVEMNTMLRRQLF
jgi:hypothetical protein